MTISIRLARGAIVKRMSRLFPVHLGGGVVVSAQDPLQLAESQPEPDLAFLLPRPEFQANTTPIASGVLLVVDVSDASQKTECKLSRQLSVEAWIPECWVVNVFDCRPIVHRPPHPKVSTPAFFNCVKEAGCSHFRDAAAEC